MGSLGVTESCRCMRLDKLKFSWGLPAISWIIGRVPSTLYEVIKPSTWLTPECLCLCRMLAVWSWMMRRML